MFLLTLALNTASAAAPPFEYHVLFPEVPAVTQADVLADLDSDGDRDLVRLNIGYSDPVKLYTNLDRSGWDETYLWGTERDTTHAFSGGDIDGDGIQDVVMLRDGLIVFARSGSDWAWAPSTIDPVLQQTFHAGTIADTDNDGDDDLLLATDDGVVLMENALSDGTVWLRRVLDVTPVTGLTAEDLDRDGDIDIIAWGNTERVILLENAIGGILFNRSDIWGSPVEDADLSDQDGDGERDLVLTHASGTTVLRRQTPLQFTLQTQDPNLPSRHAVGLGYGRVLAWDGIVGNPLQLFRFSGTTWQVENLPHSPALLQADAEGLADAVVITTDGLLHSFTGMLGSIELESQMLHTSYRRDDHHEWIATGDVDGDGDLDTLFSPVDGGSAVLNINLDHTGLEWQTLWLDITGVHDVAMADLDGDGLDDPIVASDSGIAWFDNTASGWVRRDISPDIALHILPMRVDADGDIDLVFAPAGAGTPMLSWARNNGTGWTTTTADPGRVGEAGTLRSVDIDTDGDLDVTAGGIVFTNFFDGAAWTSDDRFPQTDCSYGDLDEDGDADQVCNEAGNFLVRVNAGNGLQWTEHLWYGDMEGVLLEDFDSDGDLDLIGTGAWNGGVWRENRGLGFANEFTTWPREEIDEVGHDGVLLADFNNDGDIDIYTFDDPFRRGISMLVENELVHREYCDLDIDHDGDGFFGCDDSDCASSSFCGCSDPDNDGICDPFDQCDGNDATGDSDNDNICDDIDFMLIAGVVRPGGVMDATVFNAPPNANIDWWATLNPNPGAEPCAFGICGDLNRPVRIARGRADANGDAMVSVNVPTTIAPGRVVRLQAMWRQGNANHTQVVERVVQP